MQEDGLEIPLERSGEHWLITELRLNETKWHREERKGERHSRQSGKANIQGEELIG